ncbi:hypothetical protein [Pseudorhodoferax sp. Leaf267]|uniref:hypothetical protein n=1 Tax=Pseudorhodoferax sp. Leaf267 TaxID=1736316 RepID=UPI0012E1CE33|nr:hypothetical protein [Pseudorhodoferax sp. Leaf267]
MSTRLVRTLCQRLYLGGIAGIAQTAALQPGHLPYSLLSMVQHRDVLPYLVALKSFHARLPARRVVVVCDPSITAEDRVLLARHVPHIVLREAAEFVDPHIPRGGTWERLYAISEYARDDYVVQLDADTLTLGALPEVQAAIVQARGFVIGESVGQTLETLPEVAQRARAWLAPPINSVHIQAVVEAMVDELGLPPQTRYVRGCSGFTGFPPDAAMRARLLAFSAQMRERHGPRWADWGTEQITSNYLVANAQGTQVLPFPRYGTPDAITPDAAFMHFIGYLRFVNRRYERLSRREIARLPR